MKIRILDDSIAVDLTVVERVFSLSRSFSIPLSKIVRISSDMPPPSWKEIRAPGTYLPGIAKYGSYYIGKNRSFWLVRKGAKIVNIEVTGLRYKQYILEVENNEELVATIKSICPQLPEK
jgi:hypothetical protein